MNIKSLILTSFSVLSLSANALINLPGFNDGGELIFSAWNPVTLTSYTQDLGISHNDMLANFNDPSYGLSFNVDSLYNTVFSTSNINDIVWNISSANDKIFNLNFSVNDNGGVLFSHLGRPNTVVTSSYVPFFNIIEQHDHYIHALHRTNSSPGDITYAGTYDNGAYAGYFDLWSSNWGQRGITINNSALVGEAMNFFHMNLNSDLNSPGAYDEGIIVAKAIGNWVFNGSTIEYNTSVVPIPAAVWLLASGLIGFSMLVRRRKK